MRIAFLHDWEPDYEQELTWEDGLCAALQALRYRGHEVAVFTIGQDTVIHNPLHDIQVTRKPVEHIEAYDPDVILVWADFTRPHARPLRELGKPMAICFAGGDPLGENLPFFDHVFVESSVYADAIRVKEDVPITLAFGTNTDLFAPYDLSVEKQWDTIFPATFAAWKRHWLYAQAVEGMDAFACGYMYHDHEQECWQECMQRGVTVAGHLPASTLRSHYAMSRVCVITSSSAGGSQRTLLEAMSMNLPVVITDSDKFDDYIKDQPSVIRAEPNPESVREAVIQAAHLRDVDSRSHIVANWSEYTYAKKLEEGLKSLL